MFELAQIFVVANPEKTHDDFFKEITEPLQEISRTETEYTDSVRLVVEKANIPYPYSISYERACLFCMLAQDRFEAEDINYAWSFVAEADFYMGYLYAAGNVRANISELGKFQRKEFGKIAAAERNRKKFGALKEIIYELIVAEVPPSGKWRSLNNAGDVLAIRLLEEAIKRGVKERLVDGHASETIQAWLKQMPDIEKYVNYRPRNKSEKIAPQD